MGQNSQSTQQSQTQTSNPWAPAQPALTNLLAGISNTSTSRTPAENAAVATYMSGVGQVPGLLGGANPTISQLLNGTTANKALGFYDTGFNNLSNTLNSSVGQLGTELSPYLNPNYVNPNSNPEIQAMLYGPNGINEQITSGIEGQFAAAGRDPLGNGAASKALGTALTAADTQALFGQYNTNVGQQQNAANMLSGAQQGAAGTIENAAQATGAANAQIPTMALQSGLAALGQYPGLYSAPLTAAQTAYSLPYQNYQFPLSEIQPIAGLGGQVAGTGMSTTTQPVNPYTTGLGLALGAYGLSGSDEELKENIEPVGLLANGLPVYKYNLIGSPRTEIGVLAQDVEQVKPEAVVDVPVGIWAKIKPNNVAGVPEELRRRGSVKMVDYNAATQPDNDIGLWRRAA